MDSGPRPDVPIFDPDGDGDGLCDATERDGWGTDPTRADSDGDGIPDGYEIQLGYDPLRTLTPDPTELVLLDEVPIGVAQMGIVRAVNASGQNFLGAFQAVPLIEPFNDPFMMDASTFLTGIIATTAVPRENVFEIDREGGEFLGVIDRTQLAWEIQFAYGETMVRGCARVYPWRFSIKRSDGRLVYLVQRLLVVIPPGSTLQDTTWCSVTPCR